MQDDPVNESAWYLVHTHSGKEKQVTVHLERQGFKVFLPLGTKVIKIGRQSKRVTTAYFPAYIFVSFDRTFQNWRPINGTFGVKKLVCFNQIPARVPRGIMDALFARLEPNGLLQTTPSLTLGDKVRIADGPFAGQIAEIEALPSRDRARLLLDIMSQSIPIEIDRKSLELV
jgi:transcriptional antiterminator RfaH